MIAASWSALLHVLTHLYFLQIMRVLKYFEILRILISFPDSWSHLKVSVDIPVICESPAHLKVRPQSCHMDLTACPAESLRLAQVSWDDLWVTDLYKPENFTPKRIHSVGTVNWWWMFTSLHEQTLSWYPDCWMNTFQIPGIAVNCPLPADDP